ncbi:unnamed protein product [Rotaria magnacalcarata]|uniref:Uncharacterized protein n=3 Tax=Rotaria magnacalcarata TaxID=392030 RepID=A0A816RX55_9BILA|nr:unnamed protein product [Rotaria magnacalcarata]CAF2179961.1 unnamed protein product [Rotaria magnacalcarata]CAF3764160.1 unnamed protein product [Rotaria magnacalcarata]CAF3836986.1 unnamed protein product [Rotaria magnacalcarata]
MTDQYPSAFIQEYPTKIAFLIDCANGLNSVGLTSRFMDDFPLNSDVFLFYPNNEAGMNHRLRRIEANNHGVFFFPTSEYGIAVNISFLLGQINNVYNDFILIVEHHPAYEDICQALVQCNDELRNHIQVRSFERVNEFEQFLKEMTRLQNENEHKKLKENHKVVVNYSKKHLFHCCPFETRLDSSILYRFGEFLHHLDTEHTNVYYEYCAECQQIVENHNLDELVAFEEHIKDQHWENSGFHLTIRTKK